MNNGSTPSFSLFDPTIIPYQYRVIEDVEANFDYAFGTHELLLSGSVGSAKSILLAHMAVKHCLKFDRARVLVGRRALPDLRTTIWQKIIEHMDGSLIEDVDYSVNFSMFRIRFINGSEILCKSWADKVYKKFRSLELSAAIIEELTENNEEDKQAYLEIKMRVGRLPHIKENWIVSATNPDSPSHWAYKYFIEPNLGHKHPTKHVYYSVTTDNPFLPRQYIEQLKNDLDPKMARRMIYGEWIEIQGEVIYYAYDKSIQFRNYSYTINPAYPVILAWDFNIGEGKPLSMCLMQFIDDTFHIFAEVVVDGSRTADTIEELDSKGMLKTEYHYLINGDSSGKNRDTRSSRSDYDIIQKELSNRNIKYSYQVPVQNPPVRTRHNRVNAYCKNANGEVRLYVYKDAPTVDEGLRLTKLKKGAGYIEDDSKRFQHVTTALGYAIIYQTNVANRAPQGTVEL